MKLEDFNNLSDEEKATYLSSVETQGQTINDLTAERDSFKTENETIRTQLAANDKELKATKEMNFTLSRRLNVKSDHKDDETILHELMQDYFHR